MPAIRRHMPAIRRHIPTIRRHIPAIRKQHAGTRKKLRRKLAGMGCMSCAGMQWQIQNCDKDVYGVIEKDKRVMRNQEAEWIPAVLRVQA